MLLLVFCAPVLPRRGLQATFLPNRQISRITNKTQQINQKPTDRGALCGHLPQNHGQTPPGAPLVYSCASHFRGARPARHTSHSNREAGAPLPPCQPPKPPGIPPHPAKRIAPGYGGLLRGGGAFFSQSDRKRVHLNRKRGA